VTSQPAAQASTTQRPNGSIKLAGGKRMSGSAPVVLDVSSTGRGSGCEHAPHRGVVTGLLFALGHSSQMMRRPPFAEAPATRADKVTKLPIRCCVPASLGTSRGRAPWISHAAEVHVFLALCGCGEQQITGFASVANCTSGFSQDPTSPVAIVWTIQDRSECLRRHFMQL